MHWQKFGIGNTQLAHDPRIDTAIDNLLAAQLQRFGINWNPAGGTINGATYDTFDNPGQASFWVARSLELIEDGQNFVADFRTNPVEAFQWLISWQLFDFPTHILEVAEYVVENPVVALAALPAISPAAAGGLGALGALAGVPPAAAAPALAPAVVPALLPVAAAAPTVAVPAASSVTAQAPAPTPPSPPAPPGPPAPPPPAAAAGPAFFPPYVVGPPGIGSRTGMSTSASSSAKKKAPEPDAAAAAAASAARGAARARRRRRAKQRGYGDEYMDMNVEVDPDWGGRPGGPVASTVASDRGAGSLGFAGTAAKETAAEAAGLTTLAGDEFGGGPRMPMLPGTWDPDGSPDNARVPAR